MDSKKYKVRAEKGKQKWKRSREDSICVSDQKPRKWFLCKNPLRRVSLLQCEVHRRPNLIGLIALSTL